MVKKSKSDIPCHLIGLGTQIKKIIHKVNKSGITLYEIMADHAIKWEDNNGDYARASCPFCSHEDNNHYLIVSKKKNLFYCSRCHLGGDRFSYITKVRNCSFVDACFYLAQKYVHTDIY